MVAAELKRLPGENKISHFLLKIEGRELCPLTNIHSPRFSVKWDMLYQAGGFLHAPVLGFPVGMYKFLKSNDVISWSIFPAFTKKMFFSKAILVN